MTDPDTQALTEDEATARMVEIMNHGWLTVVLSLGERLGLQRALAEHGPMDVAALAAITKCDIRYLTEWLWAMAAGGIAEHADGIWRLWPQYLPSVTPAGGPRHWSRITTQITAMAGLEDQLVDAFRHGTGMPADRYEGHMVEVLAAESGPIFERVLRDEILPRLGIAERLQQGARVLDAGCGTGAALLILAADFPASEFLGIDQSRDAIAMARAQASQRGLANLRFQTGDVEDGLPGDGYDLVMAANTVHDLADPVGFIASARAALAPDGVLYLHELDATADMDLNIKDPHALGMLAFSLYHCVPLAKRRDGIAPGPMWGRERYLAAIRAAGFAIAEAHKAPSDPHNVTLIGRRCS
jgi:SAM-dependent methyltransferase